MGAVVGVQSNLEDAREQRAVNTQKEAEVDTDTHAAIKFLTSISMFKKALKHKLPTSRIIHIALVRRHLGLGVRPRGRHLHARKRGQVCMCVCVRACVCVCV